MSGRVVSLHIRTEKHGAPIAVAEVIGRAGGGLEGDVHAHRTSRAVLVIDRATLNALGLRAGDLREEITIEGLPDVTNLPENTELRIGGVTLRVNGPCDPCTHIGELLGVPDPEEFRQSLHSDGAVRCAPSSPSRRRSGSAIRSRSWSVPKSSTESRPFEGCSATFASHSLGPVSERAISSAAAAASEDGA